MGLEYLSQIGRWASSQCGYRIQWTPTGKGGVTNILRQLWQSPVVIEVNKPFIRCRSFSLTAAVSGALGIGFTGVSLPWLLDQRRQRVEKKKRTYCRYCGAKNPEDFEICNTCGKPAIPLAGAAIPASPTPPSPGLPADKQSSVGTT